MGALGLRGSGFLSPPPTALAQDRHSPHTLRPRLPHTEAGPRVLREDSPTEPTGPMLTAWLSRPQCAPPHCTPRPRGHFPTKARREAAPAPMASQRLAGRARRGEQAGLSQVLWGGGQLAWEGLLCRTRGVLSPPLAAEGGP